MKDTLTREEERIYRKLYSKAVDEGGFIEKISLEEVATRWLELDNTKNSLLAAFHVIRQLSEKGYLGVDFGWFEVSNLQPKEILDDHNSGVANMSDARVDVNPNDIFIVHGRDSRAIKGMKDLLRAVSLTPVDWEDAVSWTGQASPYILDVILTAFSRVRVAIVLFTPDEFAQLREALRSANDVGADLEGQQPRPNVLIEAGMALAIFKERTLLVHVGQVRTPSDLHGLNYIRIDGTPESNHRLIGRLQTAGCTPRTAGGDFLRTGFGYLLES
jgi:predicted nucleotide-binding protein